MTFKLFVLSAALVLGLASSASAQPYDPCDFSYPVAGCVDGPRAGQEVSTVPVFGGWSINCITGRHVGAITLYRRPEGTLDGEFVPATVYWGPRPDVQTWAMASGCNGQPEAALGYSVVPNSPQPVGDYVYSLLFTDAPFSHQSGLVYVPVSVR